MDGGARRRLDRDDLLRLQFQEVEVAVGEGCMGTRPGGGTAEGVLGEAEKGCRPLSSDCQLSDLGAGSPAGSPNLGRPVVPSCLISLLLPGLGQRQPSTVASQVRLLTLTVLLRLSSLSLPAVPSAGKLLLQSPHVGTSSSFRDEPG